MNAPHIGRRLECCAARPARVALAARAAPAPRGPVRRGVLLGTCRGQLERPPARRERGPDGSGVRRFHHRLRHPGTRATAGDHHRVAAGTRRRRSARDAQRQPLRWPADGLPELRLRRNGCGGARTAGRRVRGVDRRRARPGATRAGGTVRCFRGPFAEYRLVLVASIGAFRVRTRSNRPAARVAASSSSRNGWWVSTASTLPDNRAATGIAAPKAARAGRLQPTAGGLLGPVTAVPG